METKELLIRLEEISSQLDFGIETLEEILEEKIK